MAIVISVDDDDNDDVDEEEEEEAGTGEDASTDEEAGGKGVRGSSVLAIAMAKSANSVLATWSRFVPYCTSWRPRRLASNASWMTVLVGNTGDLVSKEMNVGAVGWAEGQGECDGAVAVHRGETGVDEAITHAKIVKLKGDLRHLFAREIGRVGG